MKRALLIGVISLLLVPTAGLGQDMREAYRKAEEARKKALERQAEIEAQIFADRDKLTAEVERLEARQKELEKQVSDTESYVAEREQRRVKLEDQWAQSELDFKEISGNVRLAARDVEQMLHQSYFSAFDPGRVDKVAPLNDKGYFPDIDDIRGLADVLFEEIELSGQVRLWDADFTGRDGSDAAGTVMTLGRFTAAYRQGDEIGFLNYSPEGHRFFALSTLPSGSIGRTLRSYIQGESEAAPIDMSLGNALRQISHQVGLAEQLQQGGPLVWPILALAVAAVLLILYKIFFLQTVHSNTDSFMGEVNEYATHGDWKAADEFVERRARKKSPVIEVIRAGLSVRSEDRETQESVLQEAILRQLPRVERGLAMLAVFGAVAPLLGLLGTVTGMIETFRVITLYGTGDPKLMSGGISEALVTTELGLAVAIPIMLAHTFLSRRSDHIIGEMEEKAVQLTNIIQKERLQKSLEAAEGGAA
jgi:biopolymer transport protein ExbB